MLFMESLHQPLVLFILKMKTFSVCPYAVFLSIVFSGFERKESEKEIVYMYSFLRKKSLFGESVFMGIVSL